METKEKPVCGIGDGGGGHAWKKVGGNYTSGGYVPREKATRVNSTGFELNGTVGRGRVSVGFRSTKKKARTKKNQKSLQRIESKKRVGGNVDNKLQNWAGRKKVGSPYRN